MNVMHRADPVFLQPAPEPEAFRWVPEVAAMLRRRWRLMAGCTVAAMLAGGALVALTPSSYTSSSTLLVDSRRADIAREQPLTSDGTALSAMVESQVEVMRSEGVARSAVARLSLLDDPAFAMRPGPLGRLSAALRALLPARVAASPTPAARTDQAVQQLLSMTAVRRIGLTFVVEVSVTAASPEEAARLARGLVDAYLADQLAGRAQATRQATEWLQQRIDELRAQALDADRAVQAFKARTNIVDAGHGTLLNEQQLGELNSQLVAAQARVAEAQARLDAIRAVQADGTGAVPDAMQSTVITALRQKYLDDARQEAAWSARYGRNHDAAVKLRAEMAELQGSMRGELDRIARSYAGALDIATTDERSIQARLDALSGTSGQTNNDLATLRSLQSSADTYRGLYASFLQRYSQAAQDQSFPIAEARVVSTAEPPLRRSAPRGGVVLAASAVLGLMLGTVLAFLREVLPGGLRGAADVGRATGLPLLGILPLLRGRRRDPAVLLGLAASEPASPLSLALARVRLRVLHRRAGRGACVLGCVAPRHGDGATVLAAGLAHSLAATGRATALLDLACGPHAAHVLLPALLDLARPASLPSLHRLDPRTDPGVLAATLASLRERFEYVVVDLPALAAPAPAHEALEALDGVLVAARWGGTDAPGLVAALAHADLDAGRVLGVVLVGSTDPADRLAPCCGG